MAEVSKPDYLSLVNKGGSGFNVSELVTSIVASEIEPKKAIQTSKQQKTETAISGIGFLSSQASNSKDKFDAIAQNQFFNLASSNSSGVSFTATDETKLNPTTRSISDVTIAKKMIFELSGFALTDTFTDTLSIELGEWSQSSFASDTLIVNTELQAGKTYKVHATRGSGSAFDQYTRDPHDPSSTAQYMYPTDSASDPKLALDSQFRVSNNFTNANWDFKEVDNYTFTQKAGNSAVNINTGGDSLTLTQMVALIDAVDGIGAQLVKKSEGGSQYSVIITSETTGKNNGFKIASNLTGTPGQRWQTSLFTGTSRAYNNTLAQSATDLNFKLDGVEVSRSNNTVTDLIDGATLELKSNFLGNASLTIARSEAKIRETISATITSLNEFKAEIDRLTFIDIEGDNNGPLAMDPSVIALKSNFKKLSLSPLSGYGESAIYLSQLGIKTNSNGEYFLDETTFSKTLSSNPTAFAALKDANVSTNNNSIIASKPSYTRIDAAAYDITAKADSTYTIKKSGTSDSEVTLLKLPRTGGGVTFRSPQYPGLSIESLSAAPTSFKLFIGESFSKKVSSIMSGVLDLNSSINRAKETYETIKQDISDRLSKLEIREKLITTQYTERFGEMEKSMTQFNSTKTLLENFVEAWKKQK